MDEFLRKNKGYAELVLSGDYENMKKDEIAAKCGVGRSTIYLWEKQVDWDEVLIERRKKYARQLCQVDLGLLKSAIAGNVAAAELAYARWDGWTPTSKILSEHSISDAEIDQALNELIQRKRATVESIKSTMDGNGRGEPTEVIGPEVVAAQGRAAEVLQSESSSKEIH